MGKIIWEFHKEKEGILAGLREYTHVKTICTHNLLILFLPIYICIYTYVYIYITYMYSIYTYPSSKGIEMDNWQHRLQMVDRPASHVWIQAGLQWYTMTLWYTVIYKWILLFPSCQVRVFRFYMISCQLLLLLTLLLLCSFSFFSSPSSLCCGHRPRTPHPYRLEWVSYGVKCKRFDPDLLRRSTYMAWWKHTIFHVWVRIISLRDVCINGSGPYIVSRDSWR